MQVRRHLQTSLEEEDDSSPFPPHSDILFHWYNLWDGKVLVLGVLYLFTLSQHNAMVAASMLKVSHFKPVVSAWSLFRCSDIRIALLFSSRASG